MKKTLNVVLAVILAVAMFASVAYVASPERTSEYQISLVSVKAVNVQDATQGVRSYAELVDTTRAYQVNDVIYLAITSEVKNLEKYPTLKSIANKDIKVVVGSPSIDLSYAKLGTPTLLANIWSGYTAVDVATVGWYAPAQVMLDYDKNANEVSWKFRGYTQYGMGTSSTGYSSATYSTDYAKLEKELGNSYFAQNLVVFNPYFNTQTKKIEIPAIKLKKATNKWTLGDIQYSLDYEAPDAIAYTMVLTGVTKDNAGASKGTFYAKIEISGAEKFEDYNSYWVADDGTPFNLKSEVQAYVGSTGREWREYVKVDIKKLEIAGAYNVYRYWVPSSAVMVPIPAIYAGDHNDYDDDAEDSIVDGKVLAYADPVHYDNATSKSNKLDTTDIAGGIRSMKAYRNYAEANSASGKTYDYPATSVVFTNFKAIYAPGFYGGKYTTGTESNPGTVWSTGTLKPEISSINTTLTSNRVKEFYLTGLSDAQLNDFLTQNVVVLASDTVGGAFSAPLLPTQYYVTKVPMAGTNNNKVVVTILAGGTYSNLSPLADYDGTASQQSWIVYYDDSALAAGSYTPVDQMASIYELPAGYRTTYATNNNLADKVSTLVAGGAPYFATFSEEILTNVTTPAKQTVLLFGPLVNEWNEDLVITSKDDIKPTNLTWGLPGMLPNATIPVLDWTTMPDATAAAAAAATGNAVGYTDWGVTQIGGKSFVWVQVAGYNNNVAAVSPNLAAWLADVERVAPGFTPNTHIWNGEFTVYLDRSSATVGTWDTTGAAEPSLWETGTYPIVVGHNGITLYTICSNSNDKPYVTLATETNEFTNADDGYGIAMYDNINFSLVKRAWGEVARIYRSNDTNLAYSRKADHVDDSATIISAMKYFGLDTSFGTTYKIVDATFESKGAAAVFSENVEGEFQYGTITIIPDPVDEGTEEEEVEPEEEEDPVVEEPEEEEEPVVEEPVDVTPPVVKTGDASANIAIALAAAAIVAAAGLAFVMKKVR